MLLVFGLMLALAPQESTFSGAKLHQTGFFDLHWNAESGALFLAITKFDEPFILQTALATGIGSNDLGLDRGLLGETRLVHFSRIGQQVFLIQPNLNFRASSENPAEREAVEESFAPSTLWAGKIVSEANGQVFVDLSSLVFKDHQGVAKRLEQAGEGNYQIDPERSYYYLPRTKSFPRNTEIEATITFAGEPKGKQLPQASANPQAPTVRYHLSFIAAPEPGYTTRAYHPKAAGIITKWRDYSMPLDKDIDILVMQRHRLERNEQGQAIKPIIYYVDPGAPKEIQDALIEGASWWSEAFEAAGFKNAFQVKVLPPDADPLDVRYNVIQWVHRLTRGWSYGSSISDPRTGEIIKGHVILGSLRVRQDRLIFEGMLPRDADGKFPAGQDPVALSLARIRQLAAHEVGHTLGFAHNFFASTVERASVMDYPAPLVRLVDGKIATENVYAHGIGEWDKVATRCIYESFKEPKYAVGRVIKEAEAKGLFFIADENSRDLGSFHPDSHLWDNGAKGLDEMERMIELRAYLLKHFGTNNLPKTQELARLEDVLVPVYLTHRYQTEAAAKSLGGARFDYGFNDGARHYEVVDEASQKKALALLLKTLDSSFLELPAQLRDLIPPRTPELGENRELFDGRTGSDFDELALAETSAQITLQTLLLPERLNRVYAQKLNHPQQLGIEGVLDGLLQRFELQPEGRAGMIQRQINYMVLNQLIGLVGETQLREDVRATILQRLLGLSDQLKQLKVSEPAWHAHQLWLSKRLESGLKEFQPSSQLRIPPGSPI